MAVFEAINLDSGRWRSIGSTLSNEPLYLINELLSIPAYAVYRRFMRETSLQFYNWSFFGLVP
jgi:hypothetical protein